MNGHKYQKTPLMPPLRRLILGMLVAAVAAGILAGSTLVVFQDQEARTVPEAGFRQAGRGGTLKTEAWTRTAGRVFGLLACATLVLSCSSA